MRKIVLTGILAGLMPLAAFGFNPGGGGNGDDPDPPPTSCTHNTLQAGATTRTVTIDGQRRQYILHVPSNYDGSQEVPLLLDFHALSSSADGQRNSSGTANVAERETFIVAYPQGIDNAWNIGPCCTRSRAVDDVAFARAIVAETVAQGCIDERRVYATGYSNGGGLSYKLACDAADVFAAVAPAAFDLIEEMSCQPSRPISVFADRGRLDFIVPYRGGASNPPTPYRLDTIHFLGAVGTLNAWGELNACPGAPRDLGNGCQGWTNCADGTETVLCTSRLGSHSAWDATESWNFLKQHRLPN